MKKILFGILIVAALSACTSSDKKADIATQVQTLKTNVQANDNALAEIKSENQNIRTQLQNNQQATAMIQKHMGMMKEFKQAGLTVNKVDNGLHLTFPQNTAFQSGKAVLNEKAKAILNPLAKTLMDYPEINVMIKGHADKTGSEKFNQKLSEERAMAVSNYLMDQGIDSSRVQTIGVGSSEATKGHVNRVEMMKDRRVDLTVTY